MAEEKVYFPETIVETPFPGDPLIVASQAQSPTGGTYSPTKTNDKPVPVKRIAVELLSTALNTRSRKILEKFDLQQSGGFQIGNFEEGVSGDLRLTPNGLTARDQAGITTFAIDGSTGDAVFKGQIRSGSVITGSLLSGEVILGGQNNVLGTLTILDNNYNVKNVYIDKDTFRLESTTNGEIFIADYSSQGGSVYIGALIVGDDGTNNINIVGKIKLYESGNLIINMDDTGFFLSNDKIFELGGTSTPNAPADNKARIYVDQSGGKDRLMVRFNTGASQQLAIEP